MDKNNNDNDIIKLRDFQIEAIDIMIKNEKTHGVGSVLSLEMGLGKTISFSAFLLGRRIEENPNVPDLIIVPLAVLSQWKSEIKRLDKNAKVFIYHGTKRVRELEEIMQDSEDRPEFVISTYHSLVTRELECYRWNRVVLDEAHIIRNGIESNFRTLPKKVIGAYALKEISNYCHCITGTPYNNRLTDVVSLMKFIGYPKCDEASVPEFVENFVIQKTKESIMEPINSETIMIDKPVDNPAVDISEYTELYRTYNSLLLTLRRCNPVEAKKVYKQAMLMFTKLRIFCDLMVPNANKIICYPDDEDSESEYYDIEEYSKEEKLKFYDISIKIKTVYDKLIEMLPIVPYKRIIIFSSFVSVLKIFECILNVRQSDILTLKYTGKQNRSEREKTQEIFTNPSETRPMVLLASLGAGSCGLNLTPCSTIFLADIAMNPYDQLQAINRVHRLTQQNRVNVYKFCMKDMIEEKIIMSHNRKFGEAKESGLLLLD